MHDVRGTLVRTLIDSAHKHPGDHDVLWDGRDGDGRRLAAGVYFTELRVARSSMTRKVLLLR